MPSLLIIIIAAADWFRLPNLSATWSLVIWVGLAVLTISLVILTRTRWGQSKPISKCVALSVFAHVLLMIYAYCTHMWTAPPRLALYDTFEIRILSEGEDHGNPDVSPEALLVQSEQAVEPSTLEPEPAGDALQEEESTTGPVKASLTDADDVTPDPLPSPAGSVPELQDTAELPDAPVALEDLPFPPLPADLEDLVRDLLPGDVLAKPETNTVPVETPLQATVTDSPGESSAVAALDQESVAEVPGDSVAGPITEKTYQRPAMYQMRAQGTREKTLEKYGGNARSEAAVHAALQWLADHQGKDGSWSPRDLEGGIERRIGGQDRKGAGSQADTGITGLALLAFLGSGHTQWEGIHRSVVKQGLEYLVRQQSSDGNLAGSARLFARMYCHGMAMLALGEAFAMTGDPRLAPAVRKAAAYTVASQHAGSGGWRYQPGDRGDMSQFGWQIMALRSAQFAGVEMPVSTRQLSTRFLRSVIRGKSGGLAAYRPLQQSSRTMTAEALVCRAFLDWPRDRGAIAEAVQYLHGELPGRGRKNFYYWYYASLAMHQVQGVAWERWNQALQAELLRLQRQDGALAGSWDPDTVWGAYGGRAYSTAMATLCLEVYYRYLPIYQ